MKREIDAEKISDKEDLSLYTFNCWAKKYCIGINYSENNILWTNKTCGQLLNHSPRFIVKLNILRWCSHIVLEILLLSWVSFLLDLTGKMCSPHWLTAKVRATENAIETIMNRQDKQQITISQIKCINYFICNAAKSVLIFLFPNMESAYKR